MQHADAVLAHTDAGAAKLDGDGATAKKRRAERGGTQTSRYRKICLTDPDATMASTARNRRLEPPYKQHTAVDDVFGVVLDVELTKGQANEGDRRFDRGSWLGRGGASQIVTQASRRLCIAVWRKGLRRRRNCHLQISYRLRRIIN